jgi:CRP-like cAMP-binding protein
MAKKDMPSFDVEKFLAKVGQGKTILSLQKGDAIFSQGDIANTLYYVQSGNVKLTVTSERGKEAVIAILGPNNFLGEGCLNGHVRRMATATAVDECVLTRIEKTVMIKALHDEEKLSELFIGYLLARNARIEEDLVDQLFNSSEKRLARVLLILANLARKERHSPL